MWQAPSIKIIHLFYDFILDKHLHFVLCMFRLPSKGSTFATVALAGIDVALAGVNYRGSGSRELLIEKGRALRPCQP